MRAVGWLVEGNSAQKDLYHCREWCSNILDIMDLKVSTSALVNSALE
jgi:hypothetical protein